MAFAGCGDIEASGDKAADDPSRLTAHPEISRVGVQLSHNRRILSMVTASVLQE